MSNAAKIFLGNFYLHENNFFRGVLQGFTRHTWEMLQQTAGHGYSQFVNSTKNNVRVDYLGGATFTTHQLADKESGVSIGGFVNINYKENITGSFEQTVLNSPLFMHEYGHTFDSQLWGVAYLFGIAIPSIISAANNSNNDHKNRAYERRANRNAYNYFSKYYGDIEWDTKKYPF